LFGLMVATSVGGAWWAIFTLIPLFFLKSRQGPPLPAGETYLTYPWKRRKSRFLYSTMSDILKDS
jgi:hypothetical protein